MIFIFHDSCLMTLCFHGTQIIIETKYWTKSEAETTKKSECFSHLMCDSFGIENEIISLLNEWILFIVQEATYMNIDQAKYIDKKNTFFWLCFWSISITILRHMLLTLIHIRFNWNVRFHMATDFSFVFCLFLFFLYVFFFDRIAYGICECSV